MDLNHNDLNNNIFLKLLPEYGGCLKPPLYLSKKLTGQKANYKRLIRLQVIHKHLYNKLQTQNIEENDFVDNALSEPLEIAIYPTLQCNLRCKFCFVQNKDNEYIIKKYGRKNRFRVSIEGCMLYSAYPEYQNDIYKLTEREKIYYGCRAGRTKIEVYPNGDVFPCICFENYSKPTSNILDATLSEIWKSDTFMGRVRNRKCTNDFCQKCGYYEICNGGCPAMCNEFREYMEYKQKDSRCLIGEKQNGY